MRASYRAHSLPGLITHARNRFVDLSFVSVLARALGPRLPAIGWVIVCFAVVFWRLGYPSFWDPDEARYAEASREMLAAGEWLVPTYNGAPFFDKPILFYLFQLIAFATFGVSEFAARVPTAVSALILFAVTAWAGRILFDRKVGNLAALMFAVLPGTFALSAYAILDMTFTLFLFGGGALLAAAAMSEERTRLQYAGYVMLALAVLTKGPVALVLAGIVFLLALIVAPELRNRLLGLRWAVGLAVVASIAGPWFFYMWQRFGDAFIEGYALRENFELYTRRTYGNQPSYLFYTRVMATGLLPWTPLLIGRLVDVARGYRLTVAERLLWAWAIAIVGFFSFSRFKLDHYVFPAAPALCLLCAHAWMSAHREERRYGVVGGAIAVTAVMIAAGIVFVPAIARVPVELSGWAHLVPVAFVAAGGLALFRLRANHWRPPALPILAVAAFVVAYFVIVLTGFPAFERVKPVKGLAASVAALATEDDAIAMYRMNRWSNSFRFYVNRPTEILETPAQMRAFLDTPRRHYAAMQRSDLETLAAEGVELTVIYEQEGLFTTTGRGLRRGRGTGRTRFVIVTDR